MCIHMATEAEIQKRIAEEQARIEVPSYQDVAWDGAWKRRAAGMWGIMGVAMVVGALIGLAAPLFPILGGMEVAAAVALIPKSIAIFSAIGISSGFVIGTGIGPSAGSSAATMKEFERRTLARKVEEVIRKNPDVPVHLVKEMVAQKEEDKEKNAKWSDYFNVRAAMTFSAIGAIGGLIFATALSYAPGVAQFTMPAMEWVLGISAKIPEIAVAYSMGVGALFGANFGVSHALITRKAVNVAGDLLSGKSLGNPWAKSVNVPDLEAILTPALARSEIDEEVPVALQSKFSEKLPRAANYEALIAQSLRETECSCHGRA